MLFDAIAVEAALLFLLKQRVMHLSLLACCLGPGLCMETYNSPNVRLHLLVSDQASS
nr:hypothetical protein Iba_chr11aCG8770 [Ipomoea batatas]GME05303.1 hypothetical protein Iba_scaffold2753CG0650 [Ipomoea batatas]